MITAVQSKEQILELLQENQERIRAFGVQRIGLFGSFVRDESTLASDVDLLVVFQPGQKSFDHFIELSFLLEDLLQRPVELVTPEALSSHLGPRILESVEYVPVTP